MGRYGDTSALASFSFENDVAAFPGAQCDSPSRVSDFPPPGSPARRGGQEGPEVVERKTSH
jgi:hypothetical protein